MTSTLKHLAAFFVLTFMPNLAPALATGIPVQPLPSVDTSLLTGDVRLACDAILCLAGSKSLSECNPALSHFFGIKKRKLSDTLDARHDFLNLCPDANATSQMSRLVSAMARGAGRCDAKTLNQTLATTIGSGGDAGYGQTRISDRMPSYCVAYVQHEYVRITDGLPRYVGKPEEDGFWVETKDYAAALARYEREQAAKKAAHENNGTAWN